MKSFLVLSAFVAFCYADVSHLGYEYHPPTTKAFELPKPNNNYLPPVRNEPQPSNMYLPPAPVMAPKRSYLPPKPLSAPIVKPSNDYLPPVAPMKMYLPPPAPVLPPKPVKPAFSAPRKTYIPPAPVAPAQPSNSYLPPSEESAPVKRIITPPAPRLEDLVPPQPPQMHYEDSEVLTDEGYKTVRKHKH